MGMSENATANAPKSYARPVIVATTVLVLGTAASLAINAKAISLTDGAEAGAYVSGLAWPLALLLVIELMIHTPWADNWRDRLTKAAALAIVGGIAAWISYWHGVHVLDHWNYDAVSQHVGPLVADVAMAVATLALNRIGQAKRLANLEVANPAPLASGQSAPVANPVATPPAPVANPAPASGQELSLEADWATLEADLDADLEAMINASRTEAPSNAPASPAPTTEGQDEAPEAAAQAPTTAPLTTVPQAAADAIRAALQANPKAPATTVAADLVAAGLASSDRTGRRYVAAVKNGTAQVS
jgi:hypothetical protein